MNNIKILIYDKGYKAQGFFLDFNGLYEMDNVEELIKLFITQMKSILLGAGYDYSYSMYKKDCLMDKRKEKFSEEIYQNREKEFYSISESKIIEKDFAKFEFRIKII